MKYIKLILVLFIFVGFSSTSYATFLDSQNPYSVKLNLSGANDVAAKANANSSINASGSSILQDPVMGGMMNGYYNMMQNMNGGSYNPQELQKQQSDYAKQQINNQ